MPSATTVPTTLPPSKLAHVVLRTNNFQPMKKFYQGFLGARIAIENEQLAFLTYDDEHHRLALVYMPHLQKKNPETNGLEHIAFTFDTLKDLCTAYKQRKEMGIEPGWCVNHGPTTSMYYQDPDGNTLETQVDNFDTNEDANAFVEGPLFHKNPIGVDFDPEELSVAVLERGEDESKLKARKEIGAVDVEKELQRVVEKMGTAKAGSF